MLVGATKKIKELVTERHGNDIVAELKELGYGLQSRDPGLRNDVTNYSLALISQKPDSYGQLYPYQHAAVHFTGFPGCCGACILNGVTYIPWGAPDRAKELWVESWQYFPFAHSILIATVPESYAEGIVPLLTQFGWTSTGPHINYVHHSEIKTWVGQRKPNHLLWHQGEDGIERRGYAGR